MKAAKNQPIKTRSNELASTWFASTQRSQIAAPNIIKPNNCFNVSIHFPGFGNKLINDGNRAIKKYGKAKPTAKDKNIRYEYKSGWINAKPKAAPIKGAVQGEATITESAPVKKELIGPEPFK